MNRDTALTIGVTLCCLLVIGQTAGTLDSAVETTPEDAITLGYSLIPLDRDDVDQLKGQLRPESQQEESNAPAEANEPTGASTETSREQSREQRTSNAADGGGDSESALDLLALLRGLLGAILDALRAALPLLAVLALIAVSVRYRERLLARLRSVLGSRGDAGSGPRADAGTLPPPDPTNVVATRWFEMVRLLDLADRRTVTPRDCVNAAIEAGVDPDPVDRLTALFEEVRYGGAPITAERRHLSREAIREFVDQYRDGGDQ